MTIADKRLMCMYHAHIKGTNCQIKHRDQALTKYDSHRFKIHANNMHTLPSCKFKVTSTTNRNDTYAEVLHMCAEGFGTSTYVRLTRTKRRQRPPGSQLC